MTAELLPVAEPETRRLRLEDGVELAADIYRPVGPGSFPVLLMRQPYGRRIASTVTLAHPAWYAARGYIVAVQDVRGRGDSGGRFQPLESEAADGAATLTWAADLAGSSGQVATYGFSYQAMTQYLALAGARRAGGKVPDAMIPAMGAWTVRDDWVFEGGAFRLAGNLLWACQMAAEAARLSGDADAFTALSAAGNGAPWSGPVPARPELLERYAHLTHYHAWLADDEALWQAIAPASRLADDPLDVPCLHVGGWHDFLLDGTLEAHAAFLAGRSAAQRLLVGPWLHMPWGRQLGALDLGAQAVSPVDGEACRFLDHVLKGRGEAGDPVRLFDIGAMIWRRFEAFPDPEPCSLFLSSDGLAATASSGALAAEPGPARVDRLVHDPWRPAPALGGALGTPAGLVDRAAVDDRADVAVYTSAPLKEPLLLAGKIAAELAVACDRPSHDLHAALSLVTPDGRAITLATGHLRVADAAVPGPRRISLHATCCTVAAGTCLRLSIQAAAWPAFAVNLGTRARPDEARAMDALVTTIAIHHGTAAPSRLLLPILGGGFV